MRRMARAAALMAALVLMAAGGRAEEDSSRTCYVNVSSGSYLCVRSKAQVGAQVKYKLERGMDVTVVNETDGWCEVLCGEDGGWCLGVYLTDSPVAEEAETCSAVVIGDGRVAVRTAPGGKRVRWVHPGDTLAVSGTRSDGDGGAWAVVDGCYINMDFIQMEDESDEQ